MKIEIKLNSEELGIMFNSIQMVSLINSKDESWFTQILMSIAIELLEKIDTKALKLINKVDQAKTNTKLSLWRHQALLLQMFLVRQEIEISDHYSRLIIQSIIDQLDKKLA